MPNGYRKSTPKSRILSGLRNIASSYAKSGLGIGGSFLMKKFKKKNRGNKEGLTNKQRNERGL